MRLCSQELGAWGLGAGTFRRGREGSKGSGLFGEPWEVSDRNTGLAAGVPLLLLPRIDLGSELHPQCKITMVMNKAHPPSGPQQGIRVAAPKWQYGLPRPQIQTRAVTCGERWHIMSTANGHRR